MSWHDLVKNNLVGTGTVTKAAILGHDGTIWGISEGFQFAEADAQELARAFKNPDVLLASGFKIEGEKFFVLQADNERVIGKKQSRGFFIYKTGQTYIITVYHEGIQPEQCSKATGALADYFKTTGY